MNPEKYNIIAKKQEEANEVAEDIAHFYEVEEPRSQKTVDVVADEQIKKHHGPALNLETLPPDAKKSYQRLKGVGIQVLTDGFLNIPRRSKKDEAEKTPNKPEPKEQILDGLNSAIRMQDHILERYRIDTTERKSEYSQLESIEEIITYANDLLTNWSQVDDAGKKELQMQLASVVLELERCRDEFKLEVKERAKATMTLRDSRDRENPSALAARTVGALNSLSKRFQKLHMIAPLVAMRKEMLILEERRVKKELKKAVSKLNLVLNHEVFKTDNKRTLESRLDEHQAPALQLIVKQTVDFLNNIHVAPYYQQAEQAKFFLREVYALLRTRESILENVDLIRTKIKDIQFILSSEIEHFG